MKSFQRQMDKVMLGLWWHPQTHPPVTVICTVISFCQNFHYYESGYQSFYFCLGYRFNFILIQGHKIVNRPTWVRLLFQHPLKSFARLPLSWFSSNDHDDDKPTSSFLSKMSKSKSFNMKFQEYFYFLKNIWSLLFFRFSISPCRLCPIWYHHS